MMLGLSPNRRRSGGGGEGGGGDGGGGDGGGGEGDGGGGDGEGDGGGGEGGGGGGDGDGGGGDGGGGEGEGDTLAPPQLPPHAHATTGGVKPWQVVGHRSFTKSVDVNPGGSVSR